MPASETQRVVEDVAIADLKPYARNARTHSKKQIEQIAKSIERFGFTNPVLVDATGGIIAGHGRVEAAKKLGRETVPVLRLEHLNEADKRAYILADNRLAELAGWDQEILAIELQGLVELEYDLDVIGYEPAQVDIILDAASEADAEDKAGPEDAQPALASAAVTRPGDVWELGKHQLVCGDARSGEAYRALMGDKTADILFTDPPYNVRIDGFASGKGKDARREFEMASGEMSEEEFTAFLTTTLCEAARCCRDGALAYVCMDWRHMGEMLAAGKSAFTELKNLCVWTKTNGGLGSFYRSQHELVFVFKKGDAPHTNTIDLGRTGRFRTNVWAYAGVNVFKSNREDELAMHPTVKPVRLVEDAIKDASKRGEIVLDPFGGSGTTLIAAERVGRLARVMELDPLYCDVIVRRYEAYTGKAAKLVATGETFEVVSEARVGRGNAAA